MKRMTECLNNEYASYILPFFWQHGDSHELLEREIDAIEKSGAKEFCVESRIHQDFCKDKWWEDFGFILKEAKKRDMGVWLLDDKKFPSGFANGAVTETPELQKKHIELFFKDVVGPKKDAAVILPSIDNNNERFINVVAYKRVPDGSSELVEGEPIPLMQNISDGLVFFDIPEGVYRIFYVIETKLGKMGARMHLCDMLNVDSCRLMLSEVYEPHYAHFKEYFGNTFKGFFSDEPCFGNEASTGHSPLGKEGVIIPYSEELVDMLAERCKKTREEILCLMPFLWCNHSDKNHEIRFNYMDTVSELYKRNFSLLLGNWCHDHGVMYIGHIIEDVNYHMRLGVGVGHFFRAMAGQDISGVDIVLNQMIPGFNDHIHAANVGVKRADPEFYRYTLAKLASSDAHLDKNKKGRALCEIFGAFGWAEGVPMMKTLADNMLVSGINHFVPHAFTNRYPCPDCPPHFYRGGKNPQFDAFCDLTKYMQRMSHLLYGGKHVNNVAVLYNCEADWIAGDHDLFQKVARILIQNQIDFDFVPLDFMENLTFSDGGFLINGECFKTIVVSRSSVLPKKLIDKLKQLSDKGIEVVFCEHLPEKYADSDEKMLTDGFSVSSYDNLTAALEKYRDIKLSEPCKYLRYYHTENEGKHVYMFCNEDINCGISVDVTLTHYGEYIRYNAWDNTCLYGKTNGNVLSLNLLPSESCVVVFEDHGKEISDLKKSYQTKPLYATWQISTHDENGKKVLDVTDKLYNLARKMPTYCGKIIYETKINLDSIPEKISLGSVGEIASLYVNGKKCTDALFVPYIFDVKDKCVIGENEVVVEVITNLAYRDRDSASTYHSLAPMGMIGPVELKF